MFTNLVLIRHAQTDSNVAGLDPRLSGWTDLPLNATGRQQAGRLRRRFTQESPIAALYSSPLSRARETALSVGPASPVPTCFEPDLREINCGELDGLSLALVQQRHRELWERNQRQDNDDFRWPGGESYREFRTRCLRVIGRIARQHEGQRVVVVTHAGLITQVLGELHGIRPAQWARFRPENTSLTELRWDGRNAELVVFNDHRHLTHW
jgi:2,3-bisphosphoglycerate-dependent phosphoglycerate mutase